MPGRVRLFQNGIAAMRRYALLKTGTFRQSICNLGSLRPAAHTARGAVCVSAPIAPSLAEAGLQTAATAARRAKRSPTPDRGNDHMTKPKSKTAKPRAKSKVKVDDKTITALIGSLNAPAIDAAASPAPALPDEPCGMVPFEVTTQAADHLHAMAVRYNVSIDTVLEVMIHNAAKRHAGAWRKSLAAI